MIHEITVPEVSEGVTTGTVIAISVSVGDQVEEDQTLLELETDKAVVAIPTPVAGQIKEIKVAEDDQVKIGAVIMTVEAADSDQTTADDDAETGQKDASEETAEADPAEQVPEEKEVKTEEDSAETEPEKQDQKDQPPLDLSPVRRDDQVAPAAPSVRRMARELGVDIYQVQGRGPGGRISADDVRQFVKTTMQKISQGGASAGSGVTPRPLPDFSKWGEVSTEPLSKVRQLTADAMSYAWSTIPLVTQYDKADIGALEDFRKEYNQQASAENKLTMTAILVKVCAAALKTFPHFNSSLDVPNNTLILRHYQHIGVAVDTPNGLIAGKKAVENLAQELNALAEKTRERKISPAEMEGGCFTISNLGGIGGNAFTPIVYAPQVAILGVSQAETQAVWNGHQFLPRQMLPLSLSYDHRVIDGADGARFLRWICRALEQPLHLVMKG